MRISTPTLNEAGFGLFGPLLIESRHDTVFQERASSVAFDHGREERRVGMVSGELLDY